MKDIIQQPAHQLVQLMKTKQLSSMEVTRAFLRRIQEVNPKLNAVVQLNEAQTLAEAKKADEKIMNGEPLGALHGLPVTIKDTIDIIGYRNTYGSHLYDHYKPTQDGTCIKRLREAGAIILGLTNVPELLSAYESDNLIYGATNNPYDLTRTPGGSSGGEAAIIAAQGSPLGLGSDGGGSIRLPAHYCGIAGIKVTQGRIPISGLSLPRGGGGPGFLQAFGTYGPMARFVDDLILSLPVLCGTDGLDAGVHPVVLGDPTTVSVKGLKVAYFTDNGVVKPDPEIVEAVLKAVKTLEQLGAHITEERPKSIERTFELHWEPFFTLCDGGEGVTKGFESLSPEQISPLRRRYHQDAKKYRLSVAELNQRFAEMGMFRGGMYRFLNEYDVLICPPCATTAKPHGKSMDALKDFTYVMAFNNSGSPAVVVPFAMSANGLPIGVQVVSNLWQDHKALAIAKVLEHYNTVVAPKI